LIDHLEALRKAVDAHLPGGCGATKRPTGWMVK
jgi:hypothetical protein